MKHFFVYRNCYSGAVSGGDTHMDGLCMWLKNNVANMQVRPYLIFSHNDGQEAVYPAASVVRTIKYKMPRLSLPFSILFVIRALYSTTRVQLPKVSGHKILVASSHFLPDVLPIFFKARRDNGVTRAVYIHHIVQEMQRPSNLNTLLANIQESICFSLIKRRFDKIIVVNDATKNSLLKRGFTKQDIMVSSNFIDIDLATSKPYSEKEFALVYCGRMVKQKGVDDFLYLCEKMAMLDDHFKAVMVGTGPEIDRLREIVAQKSLSVLITGFVEDAVKLNYMSNSKLFVFPSREEGWGITVAESLSVGTPVLCYDLPVYENIFGNQLHKVPIGDRDQLLVKASELSATYSSDSESYRQEQNKIKEYSAKFAREKVARTEAVFLVK